jgi:pimeloyl-ACP methyl ester carboxylesterase
MSEPVLVIHGIANRDKTAFEATVQTLGAAIGDQWELIPVYWGDLGAATDGIQSIIPNPQSVGVRSETDMPPHQLAILNTVLTSTSGAPMVRDTSAQAALVVQGVHQSAGAGSSQLVRTAGPPTAPIEQGIFTAWPKTRSLKLIANPDVLRGIGRSIGDAAQEFADPSGGVRAFGSDLQKWTESVVSAIDGSVGAVIGEFAGRINSYLRTQVLPSITEYTGDVLVYQRQQITIQQRIWDAIDSLQSDFGTPNKPISVLAHSLGGIVALDAVLRTDRPLFIKTLITFGSQPSFFEVMDPRAALGKFSPDHPVSLPATIGSWINYWEPMDVLAFLQGTVFRLHSGDAPEDKEVQHLASSGLWTHSSYWTLPEFFDAVKQSLEAQRDGAAR